MPGRTTGGNGLVAAAAFAFIIRRYFPASSRMPANGVKVRTTARSRRPGGGRWELRRRCAAAVRFENSKQKARDGFLRAGFCNFRDDGVMPVICPTCQTVFEWPTNCGKFGETVSIN
jgi:hypothetical protein